MDTDQIDRYLNALENSFGEPRKEVDVRSIRGHFLDRNWKQLVLFVGRTIFEGHMPIINLGMVRSGGPRSAVAWISRPQFIPVFGTQEFRTARFELYMRYSFVEHAPFEAVVFAVAHELSHVVADSVGHRFQNIEKFIDLIVMHFGYGNIYEKGKKFSLPSESISHSKFGGVDHGMYDMRVIDEIMNSLVVRYRVVGYLTAEEVRYARQRMRLRSRG